MRRYLRPRKWFGWTIDFIIAWTASIPWISFMKGIPAIVLLSVLLVAFAMAYSDGESSWRNGLLNDQFKSAWEAEDYKTAGIVLNRQLKGKKDDPDLLFRLAIVKENLGEDAEAMQIMQNLATSDRNVGAARWMLNNFYKGLKWNEMPSDQKAEVGRLLEVIVKADENDLQSKSFLVDFYLASGKEKMATALLDELARREPLMNVRAAYVSKDLKTDFRVERYAKDGVESIGKLLKDEPHKIEYALGLAQCYALLNRYSDAVRTLKKS